MGTRKMKSFDRFFSRKSVNDAEGHEIEGIFVKARAMAAGSSLDPSSSRQVVIVSPEGKLIVQPAPRPGSVSEAQVASCRRLIAPEPRRTVAVIADAKVSGSVEQVNETIPVIGLLTGLAYIGHCVVVFDGQLSMVADGCRDSDVLIIDDAVLPRLQDEWYPIATKVMRRPEIYVHDRKAYTLRPVLPGPRR
jgi:hypothetical protein